jgi:hypothetical protein
MYNKLAIGMMSATITVVGGFWVWLLWSSKDLDRQRKILNKEIETLTHRGINLEGGISELQASADQIDMVLREILGDEAYEALEAQFPGVEGVVDRVKLVLIKGGKSDKD